MAPDGRAVSEPAPYDAIVVGAGPAGSAAAAVLAGRGRRVLMIEKDRFPRPKVCGEFLSHDARPALSRLGLLERVEATAERIDRGWVHLPDVGGVAFRLPQPALGISRFSLDDLLARRAIELGAEARFGARVLSVEGAFSSGFRVRSLCDTQEDIAAARGVIGAWGRWDALDRTLARRFLARGTRFAGWSRDFQADASLAGQVHLYAFPGGYCGLSRVEGGVVNLAGVISERTRGRLPGGWEAVVGHARRANADLDRAVSALKEGPTGFLGTGSVYFTAKPPVENGMLMVGDAAGVIDPFSGEGQAAALSSGILAGETLERGLSGEVSLESVPDLYAAAWRRAFSRRFGWSAAFRRLMLSPAAGSLAARLGGERLVRFAIGRLGA
jgi:flavin-dependent dehydrogenase